MKNEEEPLVTVAILTYKNHAELEACVKSVLRQEARIPFEVLVIDNNEESSVFPLGFSNVRIIKSANNNLASARNLALQSASGRYLLFLDSDCTVEPSWLASAYTKITQLQAEQGGVVAVGSGSFVPAGNGVIQDLIHLTYSAPMLSLNSPQSYSGNKIKKMDHLPTMNAIFDRELLKGIQFDEQFRFCAEDLDLGFKLNKTGLKMFYSPGFAVTHHINKNLLGWMGRIFNFGTGQATTIIKNKKILGRHILILLWVLFLVAAMTYDFKLGLMYILAHLIFCVAATLNKVDSLRIHFIFLPFFAFTTHAVYALGLLFGPYKYYKQKD